MTGIPPSTGLGKTANIYSRPQEPGIGERNRIKYPRHTAEGFRKQRFSTLATALWRFVHGQDARATGFNLIYGVSPLQRRS